MAEVKYTSGGNTYYDDGSYEETPQTRKTGLMAAFGLEEQKIHEYKPSFGAYQNSSIPGQDAELARRMAGVDSRTTPQAGYTSIGAASLSNGVKLGNANTYGGPDMSREAASRGYQDDLAKALALQAQGKGPSMAGLQMQQGMEAALAGQLAAQSSMRGRANIGMGLRGSMQNMAAMQQAAAMEAAKMKVQEQFNAQQNLSGLSAAMRSGDLSAAGLEAQTGLANMAAKNQFGLAQGQMDLQSQLANQNAMNQFAITQGQMNQQVQLQNAAMQLQKMGLDDATIANLMGMRIKMAENDREAQMKFQQDRYQSQLEWEKLQAANSQAAAGKRAGVISGLAQGLAMFSDENMKTGIQSGDNDVMAFFRTLSNKNKQDDQDELQRQYWNNAVNNVNQQYHAPGANASAADRQAYATNIGNAYAGYAATDPYKYGQGQQGASAGGFGGGGGGGFNWMSMISAFSDEDLKTSVEPGDAKVAEFLQNINAHSYEYKNDVKDIAGHGRFVSPMAQELEKSELGKSMVVDTPKGKLVDYGKGFGVILAGTANHEKRISELEAALAAALQKENG